MKPGDYIVVPKYSFGGGEVKVVQIEKVTAKQITTTNRQRFGLAQPYAVLSDYAVAEELAIRINGHHGEKQRRVQAAESWFYEQRKKEIERVTN